MTDRRINEGRLSPKVVADAKLRKIEFRPEDTQAYQAEVFMAMAEQIISTQGRISGATDIPSAQEKKSEHELSPEQKKQLISTIRDRFENPPSHYSKLFIDGKQKMPWKDIENAILIASDDLLWTLNEMENSGGQVDCIAVDQQNFYFADCSQESPAGRRGRTYPEAEQQAKSFGIEICSAPHYDNLQRLLAIDSNTSSWVKTDEVTKKSGFAFFKNKNSGTHIDQCPCNNVSQFKAWRGIVKIPRKLNKPN